MRPPERLLPLLLASALACGGGSSATDTGSATSTTESTDPSETDDAATESTTDDGDEDEASATAPADSWLDEDGETTEDTGDGDGDGDGDAVPVPVPPECETDADCVLQDDCCGCAGVPGPTPEACSDTCEDTQCLELGLTTPAVSCREGRCALEVRSCNADWLACDTPPPDCPEGTLPEVATAQGCWTGACVPVTSCDWAPNCAACGPDDLCVRMLQFMSFVRCDPMPSACGSGPANCDCGEGICAATQYHHACVENPQEGLACECVTCG